MNSIKSPRSEFNEDRFLECQEALEESVRQLIGDAMRAGWGRDEAASAAIELIDAIVLGGRANDEVEELLRQFHRGR